MKLQAATNLSIPNTLNTKKPILQGIHHHALAPVIKIQVDASTMDIDIPDNISMPTVDSQSQGLSLADSGHSASPPGHILRLPDELLVDIVSTAAEWPEDFNDVPFYTRGLYADRRVMTLVCRRFRRLATPLLYSQLLVHPGKMLRLLHLALQSDPSLRRFCRSMAFDMEAEDWDESEMLGYANDVVAWLRNTERLRFRCQFGPQSKSDTFRLLSTASENMTRLKRLTLTSTLPSYFKAGKVCNFKWGRVIHRFPELRELRLVGLDSGTDHMSDANTPYPESVVRNDHPPSLPSWLIQSGRSGR
jgi:hypothetical protein